MNIRPTGVTLNKTEGYLEITWSDDRVCKYPLSHLREACPCVECRGGHQNMGMEHAPKNLLELKPVRDYTVNSLHQVGNYALQPVWNDGHDSGIYTWEYLRHLCPQSESSE
ncbi:MAG: DUF971 domain-containing protein [Anaerolineae bacterium]|nr:DUF971 domain-containing protein [Anaerolineae bacterium]MCA9888915.1 DUF971 domain-containing protein [Anaerolineae bacterium]MCA9891836.1 DUF971 domain-containing protein [Anaerolineae bacterium]MCB9459466.1 DUF971 domain-containing protein [Anaerolineaceae bacterium]